jgi:hypothetical protein
LKRKEQEDPNLEFLGKVLDNKIAQQVAQCIIDPESHEPYLETIQKRKEQENKPTKIVYKKNTQQKKGLQFK